MDTAWLPEIMYEENAEGVAGHLPFIQVPPEEEMPRMLLVWEYRDTGEIEPGPKGEEIPIVNADIRQYALMDVLKAKLSADDYDKVRMALGLEPLDVAMRKGNKITANVKANVAAVKNARGSVES